MDKGQGDKGTRGVEDKAKRDVVILAVVWVVLLVIAIWLTVTQEAMAQARGYCWYQWGRWGGRQYCCSYVQCVARDHGRRRCFSYVICR